MKTSGMAIAVTGMPWGASAGGSFAYADTATGITFALTKNRLTADFSAATRLSQVVTKTLTHD